MVVGQDPAGLVATNGVEERCEDGQGVSVLAGGEVLDPLVDVVRVGASGATGVVGSGWEVHALGKACLKEPEIVPKRKTCLLELS